MRYIIGIINVSSQGEQCMVIPMVGLIILVGFISNSASDVKKIGTGGISSGGELALLRIMHCWHYDGSEIWPLS